MTAFVRSIPGNVQIPAVDILKRFGHSLITNWNVFMTISNGSFLLEPEVGLTRTRRFSPSKPFSPLVEANFSDLD
jgi:hypothetical protein